MIKRKVARQRGKLRLSRYFQEFKEGEKVAVVREQSLNPAFPIRTQGRNGIIMGKKGSVYIVKMQYGGLQKIHLIAPAHLIKIENKLGSK